MTDWRNLRFLRLWQTPRTIRNLLTPKLAVATTEKVFAVVKSAGQVDAIQNWQIACDIMVDWSSIGNVNLDGAWR